MYDKHRDGSAEYYAPSGSVRHYKPPYYSDEDRSDGGYYSSESPEETDSESDDHRDRDPGRGYYISNNRGPAHIPDSESPSEGDVPESESETETDDYSDRYATEGYESGSAYDRDDYDSYGGSYDDWDDYDDDGYGEYDGIFVLLPACFSSSVYSFLSRLRRRRLGLLLLGQGGQDLQRPILYHFGGSQGFPKNSRHSVYLSALPLYQSAFIAPVNM